MMNLIGKSLVLIHVTLSLLALVFSGAILLQFVDWGWKEPRLDVAERVPSELDKRIAAVNAAIKARNLALPPLKQSQEALFDAMERYAQNHLFYRAELQRLRDYTGDAPLTVKEVKFLDGALDLEVPRSGKPKWGANVEGIDKSLVQYHKDLEALQQKIAKVVKENRDLTDKAKLITLRLNGMDEKGNKVQVGLYDLLEHEAQMQARIRFEKDYIQPQWADSLERAQEFLERRDRLEQTYERLQKDLKSRGKK